MHTEHAREEWLQKSEVECKSVQARRFSCWIECFTVDDSQISVELLWCGTETSCTQSTQCKMLS